MGFFGAKWQETANRLVEAVRPHVGAGELLLGVVMASRPKFLASTPYAVGVTAERVVLVPVDRRLAAAGAPISIARGEITDASVWGWGGSVADFLSASAAAEIRFATATEKLRLLVLGGNLVENALAGPAQRSGLEALVEFLRAARPSQ